MKKWYAEETRHGTGIPFDEITIPDMIRCSDSKGCWMFVELMDDGTRRITETTGVIIPKNPTVLFFGTSFKMASFCTEDEAQSRNFEEVTEDALIDQLERASKNTMKIWLIDSRK